MDMPARDDGDAILEPPPDFGRHNMAVFGRSTVFLSHLPMFMAPHDAQLVLRVTLEGSDGSLAETWSKERDDHPEERLYTVFPEKFALSSLYTPDPPSRGSFTGTFFRGHLERGGEQIDALTGVDVRVDEVVYAQRFGPMSKPDDLTYFLVGQGDERFLVHTISQPPDFDQILSVRLVGPSPDEEAIRTGVQVVLPGRPNTAEQRIKDGGAAMARGHVTGAHEFLHLEIAEAREIYFEEGELSSSRGAFEPTPLEVEAGFGD